MNTFKHPLAPASASNSRLSFGPWVAGLIGALPLGCVAALALGSSSAEARCELPLLSTDGTHLHLSYDLEESDAKNTVPQTVLSNIELRASKYGFDGDETFKFVLRSENRVGLYALGFVTIGSWDAIANEFVATSPYSIQLNGQIGIADIELALEVSVNGHWLADRFSGVSSFPIRPHRHRDLCI